MNADDLIAIDVHTHAEISESGRGSLSAELEAASRTYFKAQGRPPTLPEIAAYYRAGATMALDEALDLALGRTR